MNQHLSTRFLIFVLVLLSCGKADGQTLEEGMIGDWTFHPNYTLPRQAANYPGHKIDPPKSRFQRFKSIGTPLFFNEQAPTERLTDFLATSAFPKTAFSVEMHVLNHVNQKVGALLCARSATLQDQPIWALGYYDDEVSFQLQVAEEEPKVVQSSLQTAWKKYWSHIVASYDGQEMRLFVNGEAVAKLTIDKGEVAYGSAPQLELAGYFSTEPYMQLANLVKKISLYDYALPDQEIKAKFGALQKQVEAGSLFRDTFHFKAGPYLNYATPNSMNILWETDERATAVVRYGTSLPMDQEVQLNEPAYIQELTVPNLQAATPYYYEIESIRADGKRMSSGVLTFGTAPTEKSAFSFCIIGDTESRPHINHRLGGLIWEERPNFIMHLGDVTDGGKEPHKFEWTQEYFTGITPVASRIPVFPVPGNGESDLYWYNRYHRLPEPESFYQFQYANADFFMLNTNARSELLKGGRQYEWLKEQLSASKAQWKFVAHHHCPVSSDENDFGDTWKGKSSTQGDPRFDDLKKLYETYGVDVVFYGHVHAYERSWPLKDGKIDKETGVTYIKSGGGGGHLEDFAPTRSWFAQKTQRGNHYCLVDLYEGTFRFKMYDIEGRLKDFFEIKK